MELDTDGPLPNKLYCESFHKALLRKIWRADIYETADCVWDKMDVSMKLEKSVPLHVAKKS